jgi:hypothetical protein
MWRCANWARHIETLFDWKAHTGVGVQLLFMADKNSTVSQPSRDDMPVARDAATRLPIL